MPGTPSLRPSTSYFCSQPAPVPLKRWAPAFASPTSRTSQTKGKVESGVKYVRRNMWPSLRFTDAADAADLNRQGLEWSGVAANARVHGTTYRIPRAMLDEERAYFGKLPDRVTPAPYLREDRKERTAKWPGTASSDGRTPAAGSTGNGWEGRCRWDSGWARWRSGQAMSASWCIP